MKGRLKNNNLANESEIYRIIVLSYYRKGDNLDGIYQAKKFRLKSDFCYLTEG